MTLHCLSAANRSHWSNCILWTNLLDSCVVCGYMLVMVVSESYGQVYGQDVGTAMIQLPWSRWTLLKGPTVTAWHVYLDVLPCLCFSSNCPKLCVCFFFAGILEMAGHFTCVVPWIS
ncbi:hypothetical protein Q7C36_000901 [Tachysurus vachellii]|uniref:Uncharacterized protein n=1 Tax=Tachysurus vachellii TaxID=175792 RepID=A0AA88TCN6_TACVA|nr:hypothetical protein Q7C36_000901 [Tachysurus vachellii]